MAPKIPDAPEGFDVSEAQGWRGFHSGVGLSPAGAPPKAWAGAAATRFLRGWWCAYAAVYAEGYHSAAIGDDRDNPHPQFSGAWEAWGDGHTAAAEAFHGQQEGAAHGL